MDFEISPGQVKSLQQRGETFTLVDVRELWEYEASASKGRSTFQWETFPRALTRNLLLTIILSSSVITACAR